MLRASGISKDFPGVRALDGVDFHVRAGEIHALVGENGAGKSTLVKILGGSLAPGAGTAELDGEALPFGDAVATRARGLGVIYQESTLVPELDIAANVFLGQERTRRGFLEGAPMRDEAKRLLSRLGVECDPRTPARGLGVGLQQLVEVARALVLDARVLLFDEPSTALTDEESRHLFATIRELAARGLGIVYITHRLDEVFELADRVTVLRDGAAVATADVRSTDRQTLIRWMVGRTLEEEFPARPDSSPAEHDVVLEVEHLGCPPFFEDASLELRRGEILGLAGLVGAGRTSLGRAIFGAHEAARGEIRLSGRRVRFRHPSEALAAGVSYLPEDRKRAGLFGELSVEENVAMPHLARFVAHGLLDRKARGAAAGEVAARFRVKAPTMESSIRTLSGGNQQKALFARSLLSEPEVLVLDEPTRGVDVGARAEIYALVRGLVDDGLAVLLISSELEELLGMCDRIVVMREGRTTGSLDIADATQERIMELATGGGA